MCFATSKYKNTPRMCPLKPSYLPPHVGESGVASCGVSELDVTMTLSRTSILAILARLKLYNSNNPPTLPHAFLCCDQSYRRGTPQFVDLRLDQKSSLFPEGLAGSGQGEIAYVDSINVGEKLEDPTNTFRARGPSTGSSLLVMRREAAEAIISAMDAFAAGKTWGEAEAGEAASKGTPDEPSAASTLGKGTAGGVDKGQVAGGEEEAATGAGGVRLEGEDGDGDGRGGGKGPKWEEAARLAERGRKPLPSTRRVRVQPQQV